MRVYEAAEAKGIQWVGEVGINQIVQEANRGGFWKYAGIACEVGGYAGTIAVTGRLTQIKERVVVFMPIGATACSVGRMIYNREHVRVVVPRELLPPLTTVPAHTVVTFVIYGR
jgi:hypothetical protein